MDIVLCPRCRAERRSIEVVMHEGYGVCPRCETTWQRGAKGEMVSIPKEN